MAQSVQSRREQLQVRRSTGSLGDSRTGGLVIAEQQDVSALALLCESADRCRYCQKLEGRYLRHPRLQAVDHRGWSFA
jgi:hypothetical protein